MASLNEIVAHLDELLEIEAFDDYGPNGLQVPGPPHVEVVVSGVSGHLELFERAAELDADLVIAHHGIFWEGTPRQIDAAMARRLRLLLTREIGLAAYHLPLDAHPLVGNNALLAAGLACSPVAPFASHHGRPLGCVGRFAPPIDVAELITRVGDLTERAPLCFTAGSERVATVGIVSGAGAGYLGEAITLGLDAFLTGEPSERVMAQAREAGIHFLAAGHHATERLGVARLGDLVAQRFGVTHHFVDVGNPI